MGRESGEAKIRDYILFYFRANGRLPLGNLEVDFGIDPVE